MRDFQKKGYVIEQNEDETEVLRRVTWRELQCKNFLWAEQ